MNKEKYIYILLVAAIFSAILRISPDSSWTLFRVLIPFGLILLSSVSKHIFSSFIKYSIILLLISTLQNFILKTYIYNDIQTFSYLHLYNFCIHYISIFLVAAFVYCLIIFNKEFYFIKLINYLSRLIKLIIIIYLIFILLGNHPSDFLLFGNINDFGCVLNGGILIILFDTKTNTKYKYIYLALILVVLLYNDSKLSLFGGVLEIALYYIHRFSNKFKNAKHLLLYIFIAVAAILAIAFFTSTLTINGYAVYDILMIPYTQIKEGVYFPQSSESYTYRTNSIIGITEILNTSKGIGVGPGNTSLLLKELMPDPDNSLGEYSVSSHIWWYEIMSDLGWFIIIPMIVLYLKQVKGFIKLNSSSELLFSQIYIITFPIWCMSSSGLYTEFFSIILLSLSMFIFKISCSNQAVKKKLEIDN